ncbi:cytochrome P450 [Aspergillus karnatakaensis]|uniref:cytochrome P450 n=1 Tax=Aspergillus karnatakaensis TaxID=1810916 RepID=UPI003CCCDFF3
MLSLTILSVFALLLTTLLIRTIQTHITRRQNVKKWGCKPPTVAPSAFFGIPAFMRLATAVKEKRWVEYIAARYTEYGNTFDQTMLGRVATSTIEPENIKAVLATQFNDFCLGTRHREFYPTLGDGIFTLDGKGWAHSRALLRPQFTRDQVADLDLMSAHVTRLITIIPTTTPFDIQQLFFQLTIDSATHFLFGESVGALEDNAVLGKSSLGNETAFSEAFNTAQEYLAWRSMALTFYWTINPKPFREANRRIHEVVDYYVNKALDAKRNRNRNLEKKEKDGEGNGRYIFAEALASETEDPKALRDQLLNILLAGRDTTASLLSSAFWFLARDQRVWKKLRNIIVAEFGDEKNPRGEITHARLKNMDPYLRYVLNEVLRLLPPVPLNFRVATKDTTLPLGGGSDGKSPIFIPKGRPILYSVYAMHRRKDLFGEDAELFRPERWEGFAPVWQYLPFNGGARMCLGQQYALTEASFTIVRLLMRFEKLENGEPEVESPRIQSNLTLAHGGNGVVVRLA